MWDLFMDVHQVVGSRAAYSKARTDEFLMKKACCARFATLVCYAFDSFDAAGPTHKPNLRVGPAGQTEM